MDAERIQRRHDQAGLDYRSNLAFTLHAAERAAEESWTPGQAMGEILEYLNRVEGFTAAESSASAARKRMRWLTCVLAAAVQRAQRAGLDPARLGGLFRALRSYDDALGAERTVAAPAARAAGELIRLEVSYLVPDMSGR